MSTSDKILDTVQLLIQTKGYNSISYQDISDEIGIRKASIHYHYASKAQLGSAIVDRYRQVFSGLLQKISDNPRWGCARKLTEYIEVFRVPAKTFEKICLCGSLSAEFETLPVEMQKEVAGFFEDNHEWLTTLLKQGKSTGEFSFAQNPADMAKLIFSALEGGLLITRSYKDINYFNRLVKTVQSLVLGKGTSG